ncbi:hypothetical protein BD408DRAFT_413524 [Parasitella parasitica]|nr:hypothetical protein BD408DRAFT_413524 [Parasitella parasitica]
MCLQWCKQKAKARNENVNSNCAMLCFSRPTKEATIDESGECNPFKGYTVSVLNAKKECTMHPNEMAGSKDTAKQETNNLETTYKLDLGDIWTQADVTVKQAINDKIDPLYNSSIEQVVTLKDSPQATRLQEYVKSKSNDLLSQVYPMSPFKIDGKSNATPSVNPDEKK